MKIRPATRADAADIEHVARASWHAAYDDIIGVSAVDEMVDDWYEHDELADSIEQPDTSTVVANGDDEIVGFAQGVPTEDGPAEAAIPRIYVHPDHWGEGIGTALLGELSEAMKGAGYRDVWLTVLAENEVGRKFYEARGFDEVGRRATELAGVTVDELVLYARL